MRRALDKIGDGANPGLSPKKECLNAELRANFGDEADMPDFEDAMRGHLIHTQ